MRATEFLLEDENAIPTVRKPRKPRKPKEPKFIEQDPMDLMNPLQLRTAIIGKIREIENKPDLVDILKMANKYQFKTDVADFSAVRDYRKTVSDVILSAIGNSTATPEQIRSFLKKVATDGVINEAELLKPGHHSLEQIILPDYLPVFHSIKRDIFSKISGKIGEKGDIGKGEYLFSVLSPKIIRRGAPGDLDILGTKVELKAGENGRIGPAGSVSLSGRFGEFYKKCIDAKLIDPNKIISNDVTEYNFDKAGVKFFRLFGGDPAKTKAGLTIALKMHYPSANVTEAVNNIIVGNRFSTKALKGEMLKLAFSTYQAAKGFDGILVIDPSITKYVYINTPENAKESWGFLRLGWPGWKGQSDSLKVTVRERPDYSD